MCCESVLGRLFFWWSPCLFDKKMSKAIRAVEAEIATKIAENRSNCDFICHALLDLGLDEEMVGCPLAFHLRSILSFQLVNVCTPLIPGGTNRSFLEKKKQDVAPLRKHLEAVSLGEGYGEFLIAVDNLMSCEPSLDRTKINPMILEAWNFVYDTAKLKVLSTPPHPPAQCP